MQGCVSSGGFVPADCSTVVVPACPDPPLPEGRPTGYVELCREDGTPIILVLDRVDVNNDACPPVAPGDPSVIGWIDPVSGAYTPGAPGFAFGPCAGGGRADVEVAGRICVINSTTGAYEGSVFVEGVWDTSTDPPTFVSYQYAYFPADGSAPIRPYTLGATQQFEPCPAGGDESVLMHDCVNGVCTDFIRWYNSSTKLPVGDRNLDGTPYVPAGTVGAGPCPTPDYEVELLFDNIPGTAPTNGTVEVFTWTPIDAISGMSVPTAAELAIVASLVPATTEVSGISAAPPLSDTADPTAPLSPFTNAASLGMSRVPLNPGRCAQATFGVSVDITLHRTPYGVDQPVTGGDDALLVFMTPASSTVLTALPIPGGVPTGGVETITSHTIGLAGLSSAQYADLALAVGCQTWDEFSNGGMDWFITIDQYTVTVDNTPCLIPGAPPQCIPVEAVKTFDCSGALVVTPYALDGTPYTVVGSLGTECCLTPLTATGQIVTANGVTPSTYSFGFSANNVTIHNLACCPVTATFPGGATQLIAPGASIDLDFGCDRVASVDLLTSGCTGDVLVNARLS